MARLGKLCKFLWQKRENPIGEPPEWSLISPSGVLAATVWGNGTWHSWDRQGVGGENSQEDTVAEAKRQAFAAVALAGHHEIRIAHG